MSAKLFNEPHQTEHPQHKRNIKKIDDLILDAEMEAQAEINRKIRSNNTRLLLVVLVIVGLFYVSFSAMEDQTLSVPSFLIEETQTAQAPAVPETPPKPIPFPVTQSAPAGDNSSAPVTEAQEENLSPLENEALSMIQKNLNDPSGKAPSPESEPEPKIQTPPATVKPAKQASGSGTTVSTNNKASAAATSPRLTEAQGEYFIQVGAFSIKANADRVIKKLMIGGFSPLVQTRATRPSMHVVFIGGFADAKSPQSMISELKNKGLNPALKKNDNGSYSIILGKKKSKKQAEALRQDLTKQGIFTSVKQMKVDMRMFIVRVGGYENNQNALQGQKKLEDLGYKGTLIRRKS